MKHTKFILGTIFGIMISASIAVFALSYYATDITYKNKTVEDALNELYGKSSIYGVKKFDNIRNNMGKNRCICWFSS